MAYETIRYEPGAVARLRLSRPEKLNAQSYQLLYEMDSAFAEAVKDPVCGAIVLSGEGRSFSVGHDIDSADGIKSRQEYTGMLAGFGRTQFSKDLWIDMHLRWRNLPKPTIAMVHGYCIFGGWMIASAMDIIFAAEDALLIPTYGDYFTTAWDLGARKAKEVLYENRFMTAKEAMNWGFVNRVYPAGDLESQTLAYAARVFESGQFYNRTVKFAINQTLDFSGFTNSVTALGATMISRDPTLDQPQQPAGDPPLPSRFRGMVGRAIKHLREDREKSAPIQ